MESTVNFQSSDIIVNKLVSVTLNKEFCKLLCLYS